MFFVSGELAGFSEGVAISGLCSLAYSVMQLLAFYAV
jgi:hypothetical protein